MITVSIYNLHTRHQKLHVSQQKLLREERITIKTLWLELVAESDPTYLPN